MKKEELFEKRPMLLKVDMPLYGGFIYVRPMTMAEQTQLAELGEKYKESNALTRIKKITLPVISWVLVDPNGEQWFTQEQENEAVEKLAKLPASVVLGLQDKIIEFSGLTEESRQALAKNLMSQGTLPDSL
ncbi:MAG: hypothetical protein WC322_06825 [Candidatus Paceibacterota bacterium]